MSDFSVSGNWVRKSGGSKLGRAAVSPRRRKVPSPNASYLEASNLLQYSGYSVNWKIP